MTLLLMMSNSTPCRTWRTWITTRQFLPFSPSPQNSLSHSFRTTTPLSHLARPINVISGTRPPSIYNMMSEDTINDKTLTTFYLPPGTEKALHITSQTTTQDVVRVLLKKFRVADSPHKYALYERNMDDTRRDSFPKSKSLSRLKLRRLNEDEKPLMLAVLWMRDPDSNKKFVLQENDPGEIQWEQFSLPELKNFLLILDREEAWYKRRIHEKYETVQEEILRLLHEKNREAE